MSESLNERHNRLAAEIGTRIVMESGATPDNMTPVLVLLESIIGGVITSIALPDHQDDLLNFLVAAVRSRMRDIRLLKMKPGGSA